MTGFSRRARCRASAVEVFKLLHDPARFPDWWAGTARVEEAAPGGEVTRYVDGWPDFAYPTRVAPDGDGAVIISCLVSDIVHEWRLEPDEDGCAIAVRVELPEREAARIDDQRAEVGASLERLVALAELEAGAAP